ncbi:LytTR family DNA-binding domain-containing protein [Clostridium sp. Marseille-Q2269]|uniref:LytR/AlgR family response regulator transcription factor n=1 Tax=Clostridium sp. Marseille-Q2269 TaxID=2942205 RepID=UPI0020740B61|nr:LytTR family DNA-binding domain-containing protein [Clostridium sp. Marseille-Q2269]
MLNILVVEDSETQRKSLVKVLKNMKKEFNILEASTVEEGLKISKISNISLFYIDIGLGKNSGIDLAIQIREMHQYKLTWIIFLTTHISYILEAFTKTHCYDYIIKRYDAEKIKEITLLLTENEKLNMVNNTIEIKYAMFNIGGIWLKVALDEIIFIEVFGRTSYLHTVKQVYKLNYTPLKKIIEILKEGNFMQCHRSYVINLDKVKSFDKISDSLMIYFQNYKDGVSVGKMYKKKIEEFFKSNMKGLF